MKCPLDKKSIIPNVRYTNCPLRNVRRRSVRLPFERTYIGRTLPGGAYQQPLFPIGIWNYHFDAVLGIPRTTNAVEA